MANDDTLTDTEISEWEQVVTTQVWNTLESAFQSWINANMGQLLSDAMAQINSNSNLTNQGQVYDGLSYELVGEDKYVGVQGNFSTVVGQDDTQLVEGSRTVTINQTDTKTVQGDFTLTMQQNSNVSAYADEFRMVYGNSQETIGLYKSVNLANSITNGTGEYAGSQDIPTQSAISDYSNNAASTYQGIAGNSFKEVGGNETISVGAPLSGSYPSQSTPDPSADFISVETYNGNKQTNVTGTWEQNITGDAASTVSGDAMVVTYGNSSDVSLGASSSVTLGATNSTFIGVAIANSLDVTLSTSLVAIGWTGLSIDSTPYQIQFADAVNLNSAPISLEPFGFRIM